MMSSCSLSRALVLAACAGASSVAGAVVGLVALPFDGTSAVVVGSAIVSATASALGAILVMRARQAARQAARVCVAAAKGNLEARALDIREGGDLGAMLHAINRMLDITDAFVRESAAAMEYVQRGRYFRKLITRGMPGSFGHAASIINGAMDAMQAKLSESSHRSTEFVTKVEAILQSVGKAAATASTTAEFIGTAAASTGRQAGVVNSAAETAATNVQTVAAAAEELSSSVAEITAQVSKSYKISEHAAAEAQRTDASIQGLEESAQRIGEVIDLINTIAAQTNLLALNATIEAARAGALGKGFAVVASEVKSLANQTAKATEDIAAQIGAIQAAARDSVTVVRGICGTIGQIREMSTSIAAAVEEQGAATREIARNMQQVAAGTTEVSTNIAGVQKAAVETSESAGRLRECSDDLGAKSNALRSEVTRFLAHVKAA